MGATCYLVENEQLCLFVATWRLPRTDHQFPRMRFRFRNQPVVCYGNVRGFLC